MSPMTTGYIPTLAQVDELHKKIAQSQAAYDLIHGHCVVVADIARRMARRQNACSCVDALCLRMCLRRPAISAWR